MRMFLQGADILVVVKDIWAAKLPWTELHGEVDDPNTFVWCIVCSVIKERLKLIALKWDNLLKHASCTKAEEDQPNCIKGGKYYFRATYRHRQNQALHTQRNITTVSQLVS